MARRGPLSTQGMNDSAQTRTDNEAAWQRHYMTVAQRRDEAARQRMGKPTLRISRYRRRELRLAFTIAVVVVGLLLAAWALV